MAVKPTFYLWPLNNRRYLFVGSLAKLYSAEVRLVRSFFSPLNIDRNKARSAENRAVLLKERRKRGNKGIMITLLTLEIAGTTVQASKVVNSIFISQTFLHNSIHIIRLKLILDCLNFRLVGDLMKF